MSPPRPSNRRFWFVAVPVAAVGLVVVVGAVLTRPDPVPGDARSDLALALRAARVIRDRSGDLGAADAQELGVVELRLAFVPADRASTGPRTISVLAMSSQWLATARAAAGGCPWIRLRSGADGDGVAVGTATGSCAAGRIAASVGASRDAAP